MDFRPKITPVEVIKKGALGGTDFRDIYSSVTNKRCKERRGVTHGKNLMC